MYTVDRRLFASDSHSPLVKLMWSWFYQPTESMISWTTATKKKRNCNTHTSETTTPRRVSTNVANVALDMFINFTHLNIEPIVASYGSNITHTSLAGGFWKIKCASANAIFLKEYAKAVSADWVNRFHPVRTMWLGKQVSAFKKSEALKLNHDLRDLVDESSLDSVTTLASSSSLPISSRSGSIFGDIILHENSEPAWPSSNALDSNEQELTEPFLRKTAEITIPGRRLNESSDVFHQTSPVFASISEIADSGCFRLFFDFDTFWACEELCDDDIALISIIFQIVQATVRQFYPSKSDEEWVEFGTIVGRRTELRPDVRSRTEHQDSWKVGVAKLVANENAPSNMYYLARKNRGSSSSHGEFHSSSQRSVDRSDAVSIASQQSRLTRSSLWDSDSSSSSSSASSNKSASTGLQSIIDEMLLQTNNTVVDPTIANADPLAATRGLVQDFSTSRTTSSKSSKKPKNPKPKAAGSVREHYIDSPATVAAVEQQLRSKGHFTPHKLGMNAHFPNILVSVDFAKYIREHVVVQIVTSLLSRPDLICNSRLLFYNKSLVKLSEYSLWSTLSYWNNKVVDVQVYGTKAQGPHCRMIFSRKISKCRHCAQYQEDVSGSNGDYKKRNHQQMMTGDSNTGVVEQSCIVCSNTGKADEGPDAVSHGMFAIKGDGTVHSRSIEACMDMSRNPRKTATCVVLQKKPIIISGFGSQLSAIKDATISCVWTPCVRWLPKRATSVEVLCEKWVSLTTIRYEPSIRLANGGIPDGCLSSGFVCPPCWCHQLHSADLNAHQTAMLSEHMKHGFTSETPSASSTTSTPFSVSSTASALNQIAADFKSTNRTAENTEHAIDHDGLGEVLSLSKYGRLNALRATNSSSAVSGGKPQVPGGVVKYALVSPLAREQLQNLILGSLPHLWGKLHLNVPVLCTHPWPLNANLPKAVLGDRTYEYYSGAEKKAVQYTGICWTISCSGASSHCCTIKNGIHSSATIHFRVTPTHVFQLCHSRSTESCFQKFSIVCQVPSTLSKILFTVSN